MWATERQRQCDFNSLSLLTLGSDWVLDFFFFSFFFFVRTCVYALKNMVSYNHHGYLTLEYKNFFFLNFNIKIFSQVSSRVKLSCLFRLFNLCISFKGFDLFRQLYFEEPWHLLNYVIEWVDPQILIIVSSNAHEVVNELSCL